MGMSQRRSFDTHSKEEAPAQLSARVLRWAHVLKKPLLQVLMRLFTRAARTYLPLAKHIIALPLRADILAHHHLARTRAETYGGRTHMQILCHNSP